MIFYLTSGPMKRKKSFHGNYREYIDQLYVTKRPTFCVKQKIQFLDVMREIRDKASRDFFLSKVFEAISWHLGEILEPRTAL